MFIISKKNLRINSPGREPYVIRKDYVGEIPEDIASHWLVKAAIADGTIATPHGKKDVDLEKADQEASEKAREADIRPDAKENIRQEGDEPAEAGQGKPEEKESGKRNPKK
ncbi:MAG: hypothetical protein HFG54_14545 [Lachnospiraceae bacterium]|jgi:hypothetical protein|nr:hypothetical protein [Lachnospiraceae bacterium]